MSVYCLSCVLLLSFMYLKHVYGRAFQISSGWECCGVWHRFMQHTYPSKIRIKQINKLVSIHTDICNIGTFRYHFFINNIFQFHCCGF